ncbi:hypothetical protein [Streptomyces sp. KMM 9044]|uniref:hypothetical protein n=1 Tax=Streptomyces sp. KMM 9044 TaxID=2744474 RepID=UPI0022B237F5|nr:hypothetical protein [Streptomyces sp. KMM 9044]WAX82161.1 hypothetical protein HUV60_007335 [Streptomyces sp. KMM 9044]
MGSLIGELEERQAAVRLRVEELEREVAALTVRLEAERGRLDRLTVTRETLEELAAEEWPSKWPGRRRRPCRWAGAGWWGCRP